MLHTIAVFCTVTALMMASYVVHGQDLSAGSSDSHIADSQDCTAIEIPETDDALLTREEKIARLENALLVEVSKYDPCLGATTGDNDNSDNGDDSGSTGVNGDHGSTQSVPVSGIQGDEPKLSTETMPGLTTSTDPAPQQPASYSPGTIPGKSATPGQHKPPEDIPVSSDGDSIIAKQLRKAAEEEADPAKKAKLWNEYRRYKGIPVREIPDGETTTEAQTTH